MMGTNHYTPQANILVISDRSDTAAMLEAELSKLDLPIEVSTSLSSTEELMKIKDHKLLPDLVLLDIEEPYTGGFEILSDLRIDPLFRHIPVIVITSSRISAKDVQEGLTLGADDFVTSPVDWRELSARIQAKLRVKQAEDLFRSEDRAESELSGFVQEHAELSSEDDLAHQVLANSLKALGASNGHLLIYHSDGSVAHHIYRSFDHSPWSKSDLKNAVQNAGAVVAAITARTGQLVEDASAQKQWWMIPNDPTQSVMVVPLLGHRDVLGVLVLTQNHKGFFKPEQLPILQAIANQAALAIENAHLYAIELRRVNELVALHQIIHRISQCTQSAALFDNLALFVKQYLYYPAVSTWFVDDQMDLKLCKVAGESHAPRYSLLEIAPKEVVTTRRAASFSGSMDERTGDRYGFGQPPILSSLAVPLIWNSRLGGVLAIHSQYTSTFQESDRILLETISAQVGIVLERIGLYEAVELEREREASHFLAINQLQNEFIATASHDLKNPIFAVLGYSDLLERVGTLNETQQEFLAHIRHAARLMQGLVINMLDIARIEMGMDLQRDPVNLTELIQKTAGEMGADADAKGLMLSTNLNGSEPVIVLGDATRLHQVVRNVIDNAVKYTPRGGKIEVELTTEADQAVVTVRDTGIGIPPDAVPHVFEKFFRVHSEAARDIEGNGLGLAIVKSIIEQHGGQVTVESEEGQGSCFRLQLKLR